MSDVYYIVVNIWLAAAVICPYNTGGKTIWSYPRPFCVVVAFLTLLVGVMS